MLNNSYLRTVVQDLAALDVKVASNTVIAFARLHAAPADELGQMLADSVSSEQMSAFVTQDNSAFIKPRDAYVGDVFSAAALMASNGKLAQAVEMLSSLATHHISPFDRMHGENP